MVSLGKFYDGIAAFLIYFLVSGIIIVSVNDIWGNLVNSFIDPANGILERENSRLFMTLWVWTQTINIFYYI